MFVFTGLFIWHVYDGQCSASHEFPSWKPKGYYRGHKSLPLVSIPSQITPVHTLFFCKILFNPLMLNDPYMGRTAPLTSRCCILYIYSTNIRTEYFKHAA